MALRLPGQTSDASPQLQEFLRQTEAECGRSIRFQSCPAGSEFVGSSIWEKTEIVIEVREDLPSRLVEYLVAHELGHTVQYARGYPIVAADQRDPDFESLASGISGLILDPAADSIAIGFGFPMASWFDIWLKHTGLLQVLEQPFRNGRRFGTDWIRMWKRLEARRLSYRLRIKMAPPPKEFSTLNMSLEMAIIIARAANMRLPVGAEVREALATVPIVPEVIDDLVSRVPSADCTPNECLDHLLSVLDYLQARRTRLYVTRPLTNEFLIDGQWRQHERISLLESLSTPWSANFKERKQQGK